MNIALSKSQAEWLQARVADGTFASLDDAIGQIVEERMALAANGARPETDWEWTELIESLDGARAEVADGKFLTLDEHRSRQAARLARIRGA